MGFAINDTKRSDTKTIMGFQGYAGIGTDFRGPVTRGLSKKREGFQRIQNTQTLIPGHLAGKRTVPAL